MVMNNIYASIYLQAHIWCMSNKLNELNFSYTQLVEYDWRLRHRKERVDHGQKKNSGKEDKGKSTLLKIYTPARNVIHNIKGTYEYEESSIFNFHFCYKNNAW